jgi:prephenate dehydratase
VVRIAFQGEIGSPNEAAARRVRDDEPAELVTCRGYEEVFMAVEQGRVDFGVLPIENSIGGSIHRVYDLLVKHPVAIVGEVELDSGDLTRFFVVGREPLHEGPTDKTTIVFALPDTPGALSKALTVLALREVNLMKLESRPIPGRPWQYLFYADLAAGRDDVACARALAHLAEFVPMLRTLGSYASWRSREQRLPDPFEMPAS